MPCGREPEREPETAGENLESQRKHTHLRRFVALVFIEHAVTVHICVGGGVGLQTSTATQTYKPRHDRRSVGLGAYGERPRKPHIYNLATPSLPAASNGLSCHSILWISISGSSLWRSVKDCPRSNLWSGSWFASSFQAEHGKCARSGEHAVRKILAFIISAA